MVFVAERAILKQPLAVVYRTHYSPSVHDVTHFTSHESGHDGSIFAVCFASAWLLIYHILVID